MIKLKHIVNGVVASEFDLHPGHFTIGRSRGNNIQLEDTVVSGTHAVITLAPSPYMPEIWDVIIRDMASTNGTFVNGVALTEQEKRLKHNDLIRIGTHEFKLFDENANVSTQTEYYVPDD